MKRFEAVYILVRFVACALGVMLCYQSLSCVSIGSNSVGSRQPFAVFPSADPDNTMLGFAAFEKGFVMENAATTCTFNSLFPVSNLVSLGGGTLVLQKDLLLSNSTIKFTNVGTIRGGGFRAHFTETDPITLPTASFSLRSVAQQAMGAAVQVVDWSYDNKYVAACALTSGGNELQLYLFDGTSLTATAGADLTKISSSVRWHPSKYFVASCRNTGAAAGSFLGNEVIIFSFGTGAFKQTGGADLGAGSAFAAAWHPSGNWLVVGGDLAAGEIKLYTFNSTAGTIALSQTVDLSPDRDVSGDTLAWSPGGNYMVAGLFNDATVGANELNVFSFNGSLTATVGVDLGADCLSVDWSPTGTFITAGLGGTNQTLRVYQHNVSNGTLTEVTSARVNLSKTVWGCQWDKTGTFVAVGTDSGTAGEFNVYYFDKTAKTLTLMTGRDISTSVNSTRWSKDRRYIVRGEDAAGNLVVVSEALFDVPLTLNNTNLQFEADVTLNSTLFIQGNCKINSRGRRFTMARGNNIVVRSGGALIFEDVHVQGITDNNIRCINNTGAMTLRDATFELSGAYTFSQGSILFDGDVLVTGANKFTYATGLSSTINSQATLLLDSGATFSYNPNRAKRDLLTMKDASSFLFLSGCTLHSTRTGLQLSTGTIIADNKVTVSSEARNDAEALRFTTDVGIIILSGSTLDLQGRVKYG